MPKQKIDDDFEEEEFNEEAEEEPEAKPRGRPPLKAKPSYEEREEAEEEKPKGKEPRFVVYHMPERIGVLDRKTQKPIAEDVSNSLTDKTGFYMALAETKNDLQEIKEATTG